LLREPRAARARGGRALPVPDHPDAPDRPKAGTLERWALDYVASTTLATKLAPPPPPTRAEARRADPEPPRPTRVRGPGRPAELRVVGRVKLPRGPAAARDPRARAHLLHTFHHHELQAAELMAAALAAFPEAPWAFRMGLLRVFHDEVRHMALYREHLARLGFTVGDFPVRDWFWEKLGGLPTPLAFVAALGVGFEGGNLDHCARFAAELDAVGDGPGAAIVRQVGEEEIMHVRFGLAWFARFSGRPLVELAQLRAALPPPLTPSVMRGPSLNRAARLRAGYTEGVLDELERFTAEHPTRLPSPAARA